MSSDHNPQNELLESLKRTLKRERLARKSAESIIEQKSLEIYTTNQKLKSLNEGLEQIIEERTREIQKSKDELIIARDKAEQATKAKSIFLSSMSHEIRTPLNGIIGLSELLLNKKLGGEACEMLHSIKYSADNLLVIINDILDLSKIEAGKITFEKVSFNLPTLVNRLYDMFIFKAKEKNLDLTIEMEKDEGFNLIGDSVKLRQILINLIGNSLKFTEKGKVELLVDQGKVDDKNCKMCFTVKDTGIGIPADKLETIFKSFAQSDINTTRKYGGTGLGLTITKKLVELQGGSIRVKSEEGKGTDFTVVMPFGIERNKAHEKEKQTIEYLAFDGDFKILLVEDNTINQFVALKLLQNWGVSADVANNGEEALEFLENYDYLLVLMDLQMPVMDGVEATKMIRSKSKKILNPNIPIVGLSANAFAETKETVLEAGMNDFTTKPIQQDKLYQVIKKYAQRNT
jgi:signal transduction histidine kinase/ActR/RegA family two-component response regulator